MSDGFDLRLLSESSLNSPERYPPWKIARNCAVAMGAVTAAGVAVLWAASEAEKRLAAERKAGRKDDQDQRGLWRLEKSFPGQFSRQTDWR